MKRLRPLYLMAVLLFASCGLWAQDLHTKVEQYMHASMTVDHFMGSVLIAEHGKLLFTQGYGMANVKLRIPNRPETEFWIGSITKQFTAMAILELQERGKLSIHDPVCKYVPECPKDWGAITIYNLLTHTSGIPNFTSFPNYLKFSTQPTTSSQLLALFENKPLDFKPGAKFSYSNSGYEVLGYIIQRASGETYREFLEKNIFAPLGLKDTGYASSHPAGKNQAQGYVYSQNGYVPAPYLNMTVPFSAGALYSTVLDLYKWDRALNAGKLISRKDLDEMLAPHVAAGGPGNAHYGFGWFISSEFGHKEISHEGSINGFTSFNSWFSNDDAFVIVLDNMSSPEITAVSRALAAILFGRRYQTPKEYKTISVPSAELAKFVGQYQLAPSFIITVRRERDQLTAQATHQPVFPIFPLSKAEFFFKVVDAQISFVQNASGQVTGLVLHQNGRDMPAKKISSAAPAGPKAISVPATTLQKYVGQYQLAPGFVITITRSGDQLTAQATGQPGAPIYPKSETQFFYKVVDAQIEFVQNASGQVTSLVLHQNGRDMPARKIK
jgi:CubicO group peptidase (beta-lactamase class C family)